ncbi:DUF2637 domain-containing protein [Spongiactinospora rosea]|nr:DUF2637 domain-containing protein [Spongiactinospora rosea]
MNDPSTAPKPLSQGEHTAVNVTAAATAVLGLLGFVISFATVASAAAPSFGRLAWIVPLGVDLGIAVFSALDIVLARLGMRLRWLRLIPWILTAATVYLNIATYLSAPPVDWFAVVSHAVLPLLWVVAVEVGAHAVRKRADLAKADRMDGIRRSRWLLAPLATFALWRRMVLWEIRSYPAALARERDRILAKTDLQDRYGRLWRAKATRRERALYRLGELVPASARELVRPTPPKPLAPKNGKATPDVTDLIPVGRRVAADLNARGLPLTRDRLRAAVRQSGRSISTDRAGALLAQLRAEKTSKAA